MLVVGVAADAASGGVLELLLFSLANFEEADTAVTVCGHDPIMLIPS